MEKTVMHQVLVEQFLQNQREVKGMDLSTGLIKLFSHSMRKPG